MKLILSLITIIPFLIFSQEKTRSIPIITKGGTKAIVEVDNTNKKLKPKIECTYSWLKAKTILSTQGAYQGDLLHGLYQENYASKQLKIQGYYKYGLKHGKWSYWDETGKLIKQEKWKKGELNTPKVKTPNIKKVKEDKKKTKENKESTGPQSKEEKTKKSKKKIKKTSKEKVKKEETKPNEETKQPANE